MKFLQQEVKSMLTKEHAKIARLFVVKHKYKLRQATAQNGRGQEGGFLADIFFSLFSLLRGFSGLQGGGVFEVPQIRFLPLPPNVPSFLLCTETEISLSCRVHVWTWRGGGR